MKVVELLKISSPALKMLSENEVNRDDWRFVPMYEEFMHMRKMGMKYREAVRMLSEDYCCGRATIERALTRLDKEIDLSRYGSGLGRETSGGLSWSSMDILSMRNRTITDVRCTSQCQ